MIIERNTPHTIKSLLALSKLPEGEDKLNIIGNEMLGDYTVERQAHEDRETWTVFDKNDQFKKHDWYRDGPRHISMQVDFIPLQPLATSLDAIFTAEERLGLHDPENYEMRVFWYHQADKLSSLQTGYQLESHDMAFVSKLDRLVCLILAAQWKEQNT